MKTWRWIMVMLTAGSLAAACTVNEPQNDDDDSSSNGAGGSSSSSTVSSSSSSSVTASSTTTTQPGCDNGMAGPFDFSDPTCNGCLQCAIQGACAAAFAECPGLAGNPQGTPCDNFTACLDTCSMGCEGDPDPDACFSTCIGSDMDPAPAGTCIGDNPDGSNAYLGLLSCIVCQECPNNCDGVNNCM